eukprot:CAMPEP_0206217086 /NCGR_PEP_ID=MMETSP0047_2-20121206/3086_1 /ASSEMBLY_ACC=CAM_ASM_000192 /TAXON_ID=195065 /ORGANISM="Chroomonas mesostigmatica_cf, Strain CCMP1168" /LENGTH=106 /DNA_ID=CAMNT_0053639515 /DNA_START=8 /DNA_END=324 /DNA_ORIENTATION=+
MSKPTADPQSSANFPIPNSGDPKDVMTKIAKREEQSRQTWVNIMTARDLRNDLRDCFRREGVNHRENCKEFALAYMAAINEPLTVGGVGPRLKGMKERAARHGSTS